MPAKNLIQDVIPKGGSRSIRNVRITRAKKEKAVPVETTDIEENIKIKIEEAREEAYVPPVPDRFETDELEPRRIFHPKKWLVSVGVIFTLVIGFLLANLFFSVKINVTPRTVTKSIAGEVVAKRTATAQDLVFETLTATEEASTVVKSTGEKQVDTRAKGTIVVYNNYTTATQRLIKNTRFATPEGLIFRIDQSITVPGKKGSTPGSIEVQVFAEETGEKYNVGLKDFVIPGFKGDPRYTTFYARSKPGSPIEGGFSGVMKVILDADKKSAEAKLQKDLTDSLVKKITSIVPSGSVFYDGLYQINWTPLSQENLDANQVRVKSVGTITAIVFDRDSLATYLARNHIDNLNDDTVVIDNMDELSVTLKNSMMNMATDKTATLLFSGDAQFTWIFDEIALKQAVANTKISKFEDILKDFPTITKADVSVTPFWKRDFPGEFERITIKKNQ
jgi:hypothetical protein